MRGLWVATDNISLRKLKGPHITKIMTALKQKGNDGLSNAQIDATLNTASQWLIFWELRELIALGLVKYEVQPFGEPGKYILTEKGFAAVGST